MFITEEKILKRIFQDRSRGDLEKALRNARRGYEKWPGNFDIAMELIQLTMELSDYHEAVKYLKSTIQRNPGKRQEILEFAKESFYGTQNPFLGRFIIEALIRNMEIDKVADFLGRVPKDYLEDLIKRSKTKSKGFIDRGAATGAEFANNELLLGLLHIEMNQHAEAVPPLANALKNSPDNVQAIGTVLLDLEREISSNSTLHYLLGLASSILNHPEKMEKRFFRSLECDHPPLDQIIETLEHSSQKSPNFNLLYGEALIRNGSPDQGAAKIKEFLNNADSDWNAPEGDSGGSKEYFPTHVDGKKLAYRRLSGMPGLMSGHSDATFLFCGAASDLGHHKEAVEAMEKLAAAQTDSAQRIISWIENNQETSQTAPAQKLLATLNMRAEDFEKARNAFITAAEMDMALAPELIKTIEGFMSERGKNKTLMRILVELYARTGNSESAEETLKKLKEEHSLGLEEALEITSEVIQNCGATLENVVSAVEIGINNGNVTGCLLPVAEFLRENPGKDSELAEQLAELASRSDHGWNLMARLLEGLKEKSDLTGALRYLSARAYLNSGEIEKGVFTFDQLMMFDPGIKIDIIAEYEKTAENHSDNTTLLLALYQLHFDEDQLASAAHYLGKALESDPSQIRDVLSRFDRIVEKDPTNREIWEELLKSALAINHTSLAQETLSRAVEKLGKEGAAALHLYGARISRENGGLEDALKCLAMALSSRETNLNSVDRELKTIIESHPESPESYYLHAETLLRLGKEEEAVVSFEHCIELSPNYTERVRKRMERALSESAGPWLINRFLGAIAWRGGSRDESLNFFRKAQRGPADSLSSLSGLLEKCLEEKRDDLELRKIFAENLRLEKRFAESVQETQKLISGRDDYSEEAVLFLEKILKEEPLQFHANRLLARLLIQEGRTEESLPRAVKMLSASGIDPGVIAESAEEMYRSHGSDPEFILGYAAIKGRTGRREQALKLYRDALRMGQENSEKVIEGVSQLAWPESLQSESRLLLVDCHILAGRHPEAFRKLEKLAGEPAAGPKEIIPRVDTIADKEPRKEYYLLYIRQLAVKDEFETAGKILEKAARSLPISEVTDLKLELAAIADGKGMKKMASRIYSEALSETDDRKSILKRIEDSLASMAEEEIERALSGPEERTPAEKVEWLVDLALNYEKNEEAMKILKRSGIPENLRAGLLGRIYLAMGNPALAVSVLSPLPADSSGTVRAKEALYNLGLAAETLGDYGRAAAAFLKIIETAGEYRDARIRAERDYTRFIAAQCEEETMIIEKTGNLKE